ncbi:hypothetical protein DSECCO2_298980 [anaerobic digester metagenome]
MGPLGRDDDGVEAGHRALAVQVDGRVGLHGPDLLQQHVVVLQDAVLLDDAHGARPDHDVLAPVVDHGEGQLAALLDVELRDAQVQGRGHAVGRGAAGDDVDFRVLLHHDDVVHVLPHVLSLDEQAGLDRLGHLGALLGADEVAAVQFLAGRGAGEFVLVGVHGLPEVLGQAVVLLERLADAQHLHALGGRLAMHGGVVELQEGAGALVLGVHVHADHAQLALAVLGQGRQVGQVGALLAGKGVGVQIDQGLVQFRHLMHSL